MVPASVRWLWPNHGGLHRFYCSGLCWSFLEQMSSVYWGDIPGQRRWGHLRNGGPFGCQQGPPEPTGDPRKRESLSRTSLSLEVGLM